MVNLKCLLFGHKYKYKLSPYEGGINFVHHGTCERCNQKVRKVTECGHDYELKRTRGRKIN